MVNNAGYNPIHMDACDMSIESYQRVLATNLMGEFYGCKFAIPHLRKTKGSIINMSSILSKVGQEQTAGYSSTKGGINSMTQTIAIEEARHGVRVNAICPGHIMTEIVYKEMERVADPEAYLDRCNHYSWLGPGGQPEEVAAAALFLASSWGRATSPRDPQCLRRHGVRHHPQVLRLRRLGGEDEKQHARGELT